MGTYPRHVLYFESLYSFKSLFTDVDNFLAHFAEFRCPLCRKKFGKMSHAFGKVGFGKKSIHPRFILFQKILSAAIRFVSQKSKFRSELFRSHSKIWYVDPRTNSDWEQDVSAKTFRQNKISRRFGKFFMPKRPVLSWFCFWFSTNWT